MREQVLDVSQQERLWPLGGDDPRNVEKQRALRGAFKSVWTAKRILLGHTGDTEWLARKPSQQYVMVRYILFINAGDIASENVGGVVWKICQIGLLRETVPFAGKHTAPAVSFEAKADAANSCEKIDEAKRTVARIFFDRRQGQNPLPDSISQVRWGVGFACLPTVNSPDIHVE